MKNTKKLSGLEFSREYVNTPNAVLVDVRTRGEFLDGHIDKAINVDVGNINFISEILKFDRTKTYFLYCRSGNRSGQAASLMESAGITNICELNGGIGSNTNTVKLVR